MEPEHFIEIKIDDEIDYELKQAILNRYGTDLTVKSEISAVFYAPTEEAAVLLMNELNEHLPHFYWNKKKSMLYCKDRNYEATLCNCAHCRQLLRRSNSYKMGSLT